MRSEQMRDGAHATLNGLVVAFLALVFGFTAVDKLVHAQEFIRAVDTYRMLPMPMGNTLAPLIIAAEALIALGLALSRWRRIAALQAVVLMSIFTAALMANKMLGAASICGCWFSISMGQGNSHFVINGIIMGLSATVWRSANLPERASPRQVRSAARSA